MIQNVVRGVFIRGDKVLVARATPELVFLPGGHLEEGETAAACLTRECLEEFGVRVTVGVLLGVIESKYFDDGRAVHQLDLLLSAGLDTPEIGSGEAHLTFSWVGLNELEALNLRPVAARGIIRGEVSGTLMTDWEA